MAKLLLKARKIAEAFILTFSVEQEGWYLVSVSAKVKSEKQRHNGKTDDEDLTLEIDDQTFPQLSNSKRLIDSPASFSGGQLHGLEKTVYFILHLYSGNHILKLNPDVSAEITNVFLESLSIQNGQLRLSINKQAENGDRRPFITYALVGLPLTSFTITTIVYKRHRDSDDLKIIVDGEVKTHFREKTQKPSRLKPLEWFYRFWYFVGSILLGKEVLSHFNVNLPKGLHYIELWADRMPKVEKVEFDFGELPRYPSLEDPRWTGDFSDDSEIILLARLILGEAENQPKEAKIWVAGAVINRVKAKAWPNTIQKVIRQPNQYDPLKPTDPNYPKVIDPLKFSTREIWEECYKISEGLLSGKMKNPTQATHFHGQGVSKEWFMQNIVPYGKFLKQIGDTYFYWSPN